jgi:hypothetical protein
MQQELEFKLMISDRTPCHTNISSTCVHTHKEGSGCNYFTSSTADLTCPSQVVSDEVGTTLLERGGNLTIMMLVCKVVYLIVMRYDRDVYYSIYYSR